MLIGDLRLLFCDSAGGCLCLCLQLESDERALLLCQEVLLIKGQHFRAAVLLVARRTVGAKSDRLERLQSLLIMA